MIEINILDEDFAVVTINGKEVEVIEFFEGTIVVVCDLKTLEGIRFEELPQCLEIWVQDSYGFGTNFFHEIKIIDGCINFLFDFPNKYWEGHWGLKTLLEAIKKQTAFEEDISVTDSELDDHYKTITLSFTVLPQEIINDFIEQAVQKINRLILAAEISLGGITWKKEYETNEALFCLEVLLPLLRRMKFNSVRYSHGTKEYGKDFTFSELAPFGDLRHYGLQAKAGNISGSVNSDIDEIIGQIEDAFSMPYFEVGSKDPRFISVFIIAISGRFTENAKDKIVYKMPKGIIGSVYFLDKEKITELIERYWTS